MKLERKEAKKPENISKNFTNHVHEVLVVLVKKRLQDQSSIPFLQFVHVSVTRSRFVVGGHTPCLKY